VPDLISRVVGSPEHLDRCWLTVDQKRALRQIGDQIGLAAPDPVRA
jgi:hypothetical protein